jgi:mRNA interferase RelE/StbE
LEQRVIASGAPRRSGKALRGDRGEFWSHRVGDHRVVSLSEDSKLVVVVVSIGHRREAYR